MGSSASIQVVRRVIFALLWTITIVLLSACDTDDVVDPARVAAVVVSPDELELFGTDSAQLSATPLASDGTPLAGRTITWLSSDTTVATVDTQGVVKARAPGTVTIRAESEGQAGLATVHVLATGQAPPVAVIQVTPVDHEFWAAGESVQFTALPMAVNGQPLPNRAVTWSSTNPLVASVDANGLVTAHASGTAVIAARSEGKVGAGEARVLILQGSGYDLIFADRSGRLFIQSENGQVTPVPLPAGMFAIQPAASPDGRRIAFAGLLPTDANLDIWVVSRQGGAPVRLTSHESLDDMPSWSPDGSRIAFRSSRSLVGDVFTMKSDGTDVVQLTFDPLPQVVEEQFPVYSPDGTTLAYTSNLQGTNNVWLMDLKTGATRRLTSGPFLEFKPSWSPDGKFIVMQRLEQTGFQLAIASVATGAVTWLPRPAAQGSVSLPSWSPDGEPIAFIFEPQIGFGEVWTVNSGGSDLVRRAVNLTFSGFLNPGWVLR